MIFDLGNDNRVQLTTLIISVTPNTPAAFMLSEATAIAIEMGSKKFSIHCIDRDSAISLLTDFDNALTYNKVDHPQMFV